MKTAFLSFTEKGSKLAASLAQELGGTADRCGSSMPLEQWTAAQFRDADALVFVGAAGIAVRAIAPYLGDKTTDPAVVVVDECAHYAIPILSGHLGGANDLARKISKLCGAEAAITTATDRNGVFAVDEWAKRQNCRIANTGLIKRISGMALAGNEIRVCSEQPISGDAPENVVPVTTAPYDVYVGLHVPTWKNDVLWLVPNCCTIGLGCRKGISEAAVDAAVISALLQWDISGLAIEGAATIDLKKDESGLLSYCEKYGWKLQTYSSAVLRATPGTFSASDFVNRVTGVDNVCERSAVQGSSGGTLVGQKIAFGGVTAALAARPYNLDWNWKDPSLPADGEQAADGEHRVDGEQLK